MDEKKVEEKVMNLVDEMRAQFKKQESIYDKFISFRAATVEAIAYAWSNDDYRRQYLEDPVKFMKEHLGYEFNFNMDIKVEDTKLNRWRAKETGGWVGKNNTLEMIFPPKPRDDEQQVVALATFNRNHLTFFGDSLKNKNDKCQKKDKGE